MCLIYVTLGTLAVNFHQKWMKFRYDQLPWCIGTDHIIIPLSIKMERIYYYGDYVFISHLLLHA